MVLDLDSKIATAKKSVAEIRTAEQEVLLGDDIVTVRISSVDGPKWIELTGRHPARLDVARDVQLGYNLPAVLRDYTNVEIIEGDEIDDLWRVDEEGHKYSKWPEIHDVLSGPELKNLGYALWGLNDYDHQQRLADAGKASKGRRSRKTRR